MQIKVPIFHCFSCAKKATHKTITFISAPAELPADFVKAEEDGGVCMIHDVRLMLAVLPTEDGVHAFY